MTKRALILVDIQNDFMPDGALPVPGGYDVVPVANMVKDEFELVVATQDWHPANHGSFAANHVGTEPGQLIDLDGLEQILWPVHCVQDSDGAKFVDGLHTDGVRVFQKGTAVNIDSYSGFFDNGHRQETGLGQFLKGQDVEQVYVCGVATDYCVKFTVLDAVELGFETYLIEDGCRGVNLNEGDVDRAIEEMRNAGVHVVRSENV